MARFTTGTAGRPALAITVTIPSASFWTGRHVGVRVDPDTLGATDTVIALTGPANSVASRLLAHTIAHRTGARMIESSPSPSSRSPLQAGGGLVAVAFDEPSGRDDQMPVALILCSRKPSVARAVANALIADPSLAAAIAEVDWRETTRQALGAPIPAEQRRFERPLGRCMPADRW